MRAVRRPHSIRAALLCASALGGTLILAPSTAQAQATTCGPVSPIGIITCEPAGSPYGDISYTGLSGGRTIVLGEGVTAASVRFTGTGALTVGAAEADIVTTANNVSGVNANSSDGGAVTVTAGDIRTSGANSHGIYAETRGLLTVNSTSINTTGDGSKGIYTRNTEFAGSAQLVSITSGSITTSGVSADGMDVHSRDNIVINSGQITTTGAASRGLVVNARAGLTLTSDRISTSGDGATGLHAIGIAQPKITSGTITTTGNDAVGLWFAGSGAELTSQSITTTGARSHGMQLSPSAGVFTSGSIHTSGVGARGIYVSEEATANTITINSTTILTEGEGATGISLAESRVLNPDGRATTGFAFKVNGGDITTRGDNARGIAAVSYGNHDITAGAIVTEGESSTGIDLRGANVTAKVQSISTAGDFATGANIYSGGDAKLDFGTISTQGQSAEGLWLFSRFGADIKATTIQTTGAQATGMDLFTNDDLLVNADTIRTSGGNAVGIRANSEADATFHLGAVEVTGSESSGLALSATDVLTVNIARRLASANYIAGELTGGSIVFNLAANGVTEAASDALFLNAETSSVVNNAGTIRSENGYGIRASQGATTLNNSGRFESGVFFGAQADVVNNTGLFIVDRDSQFGASDDVFNNNAGGVVQFGVADEPVEYSFLNLERFNNAGTIDLVNGIAGDVFVLPGVLNNLAGSHIRLDVDLTGAAPVADRIDVGSLQGTSVVQVQVNGAGPLGETGVTVISSGAAQTGNEFTVETIGGGFLDYDLAFDDETGGYQLVTALAAQAFEPTKVASGAQTLWRRGADVVSARLEELRDAPAERGHVWAQAYSGRERIDGTNGVTTEQVDLSHDVRVEGFTAGADMVRSLAGGEATFGGMLGAGRTRMRFTGNGDISDFESLSAGVYGQWRAGPLAVAGLIKGEFHDLTYDWASADVSDQSDGETWGARVEASWRFDSAEGFIEPTGALAWNTTDLGGISDDAGSVAFGDTTSLTAKAGVRAGRRLSLPGGLRLQPWGGLYLHREFDGDNASTLTFGSNVVEVEDHGQRTWAEFAMGADVQTASGLGGFVRVEALGGDIDGYAGRVGVRFAW